MQCNKKKICYPIFTQVKNGSRNRWMYAVQTISLHSWKTHFIDMEELNEYVINDDI